VASVVILDGRAFKKMKDEVTNLSGFNRLRAAVRAALVLQMLQVISGGDAWARENSR